MRGISHCLSDWIRPTSGIALCARREPHRYHRLGTSENLRRSPCIFEYLALFVERRLTGCVSALTQRFPDLSAQGQK